MLRLKKSATVLLVAVGAVLFVSAPASAATDDAGVQFAFSVDPALVVQMVLAVFLPILVGLVTTTVTSGGRKAWLLAALTLATSVLTELGRVLDSGGTFDLGLVILAAIPAFAISVATHYGLWKPTGVSVAVQQVGKKSD